MASYDPRYLAGVLFFNAHDFFEAHEVWEDLWSESHDNERRFYQGLIQAAVGLFHFSGGNLGGAAKLYRSSRDYMRPCGSPFLGLDADAFWRRMEECFRPLLTADASERSLRPDPAPGTPISRLAPLPPPIGRLAFPEPERSLRPDPALIPVLVLDPAPDAWPDPDDYVSDDD